MTSLFCSSTAVEMTLPFFALRIWDCNSTFPSGMTNKRTDNGKDKGEMRGFLRCAAHDEAVSSFGRNDEPFLHSTAVEMTLPFFALRIWDCNSTFPSGMTNKRTDNGKDKGEMRGFLRCAAHDEAVSSFGRMTSLFCSSTAVEMTLLFLSLFASPLRGAR